MNESYLRTYLYAWECDSLVLNYLSGFPNNSVVHDVQFSMTPTSNFLNGDRFVFIKGQCFPPLERNVIRGVPRIWEGGGQEIFFSNLGICMSRSDMLRMAKPCALLGGFGGMLPRENFLKRCNLVRFKVYFDQILSLFFSKNAIFYIKNKYFRYKFVLGYFS